MTSMNEPGANNRTRSHQRPRPMIHVAEVERSTEFYRLLGFEIGTYVPRAGRCIGRGFAPKAADWKRGPNLMLTRSEAPLTRFAGSVFYLYARLKSLRSTLLAKGVEAGEISYPDYLPNGEFRLQDPDGYTLMLRSPRRRNAVTSTDQLVRSAANGSTLDARYAGTGSATARRLPGCGDGGERQRIRRANPEHQPLQDPRGAERCHCAAQYRSMPASSLPRRPDAARRPSAHPAQS